VKHQSCLAGNKKQGRGLSILSTIAAEADLKDGLLKALAKEELNLKAVFIFQQAGNEAFPQYAALLLRI